MSNQQFDALIEETQGKVRQSQARIEGLTSRVEATCGPHSLGTSPT